MSESIRRAGSLLGAFVLVIAIPQLSTVATRYLSGIGFPVSEYLGYHYLAVHHLIQLMATLAVLPILGLKPSRAGFNLDHSKESLELLKSFLLYFTGFVVAGHLILFFTSPPPSFGFPLTASNITGELVVKGIISGTAEEPLFRGLVMTLLFSSWKGNFQLPGFRISAAGLIATFLFVFAHIGFDLSTLTITWFSPIQLVQAAVLGTFYAVVFDRTGSLLTPILAHNFANVFFTAMGIGWALLS